MVMKSRAADDCFELIQPRPPLSLTSSGVYGGVIGACGGARGAFLTGMGREAAERDKEKDSTDDASSLGTLSGVEGYIVFSWVQENEE